MTTLLQKAKMTVASAPHTGTFHLDAAYSDGVTFDAAGVADGAAIVYAAYDGVNFEQGEGVWTLATKTLTRDVVGISSENNNKVDFSSDAYVYAVAIADLSITNPNYGAIRANLVFDPGTAALRITGDMSNSLVNSRFGFVNILSNQPTWVHAFPNGSSTTAGFSAESDAVGAGYAATIASYGAESRLENTLRSSGTGSGYWTIYAQGLLCATIYPTHVLLPASLTIAGGTVLSSSELYTNSGALHLQSAGDIIATNAGGVVSFGGNVQLRNGTSTTDYGLIYNDGSVHIAAEHSSDNGLYLSAGSNGFNFRATAAGATTLSISNAGLITTNSGVAIQQTLGTGTVGAEAHPWYVNRAASNVYMFVQENLHGVYDTVGGTAWSYNKTTSTFSTINLSLSGSFTGAASFTGGISSKLGTNPDSTGQPTGPWAATVYNAVNAANNNGLLVKNNREDAGSTLLEVGQDLVGGAYRSLFKVLGDGSYKFANNPSTFGTATFRGDNSGYAGISFQNASGGAVGTFMVAVDQANRYIGFLNAASAWDWGFLNGAMFAGRIDPTYILSGIFNAGSSRFWFKDAESVGGGLRVGGAFGCNGIYSETGDLVLGAVSGLTLIQNANYVSAAGFGYNAVAETAFYAYGHGEGAGLRIRNSISSSLFKVFDDTNSHIETNTALWINQAASVPTYIGNGGGNVCIGTTAQYGKLTVGGAIASTATGASFLAPQFMLYEDSVNFYLLLTGTDTPTGSFNGLRPFHINLASGVTGMDNGVNINGGLTVDSISSPYAPRKWCRFAADGTILKGVGISSVTKNGTGDFTINFASAAPDTNYGFSAMAQRGSGAAATIVNVSEASGAISTTSLRVYVVNNASSFGDATVTVVIYY